MIKCFKFFNVFKFFKICIFLIIPFLFVQFFTLTATPAEEQNYDVEVPTLTPEQMLLLSGDEINRLDQTQRHDYIQNATQGLKPLSNAIEKKNKELTFYELTKTPLLNSSLNNFLTVTDNKKKKQIISDLIKKYDQEIQTTADDIKADPDHKSEYQDQEFLTRDLSPHFKESFLQSHQLINEEQLNTQLPEFLNLLEKESSVSKNDTLIKLVKKDIAVLNDKVLNKNENFSPNQAQTQAQTQNPILADTKQDESNVENKNKTPDAIKNKPVNTSHEPKQKLTQNKPQNEAQKTEANLRCIYAGNIILGPDCNPPTQFQLGRGIYTCETNKIICNPFLYGFRSTKPIPCNRNQVENILKLNPICISKNKNASEQCERESNKMPQPNCSIGLLTHEFKNEWDKFNSNLSSICLLAEKAKEKENQKNQPIVVSNKKGVNYNDLYKTCKVVRHQLKILNQKTISEASSSQKTKPGKASSTGNR